MTSSPYYLAHSETGEVIEITDPRQETELREGNEEWAAGLTRFTIGGLSALSDQPTYSVLSA